MRPDVFVVFSDPPGPPEIIGYSDGETVLMGQDVRLECVSRGGNPLATIVWFKNNVKVDKTFETAGRESRNVYAFRAEASDNNARFRCEVSNDLTVVTMKAEVKLTVRCKSTFVCFSSLLVYFATRWLFLPREYQWLKVGVASPLSIDRGRR